MLCADEGEARRQAADLRSLTGREPVLLTGRELHWRELAAVSRQWEYGGWRPCTASGKRSPR